MRRAGTLASARVTPSQSASELSAPSRFTLIPEAGVKGTTPLLLRVTAFSIFFFPSSMVIDVIGASGTVPILLCCILLAFWLCSWVWNLHKPIQLRHPGRIAISFLILGVGASYGALYGGWSGSATATGLAAADRWLILLAASTA